MKLLGWFISQKRQESFKGVSRKFQGRFKKFSRVFHKSFNGVSRKFQGCLKEVSRVFQESFKGVSRNFQGSFKDVSRKLLRVFHESFMKEEDSRMFQGSFMIFMSVS